MSSSAITLLPIREDECDPQDSQALYQTLEGVLRGEHPPLLPVPGAQDHPRYQLLQRLYEGREASGAALIMATSGTTGTPKAVRLTTGQLRTACTSTHAAMGGEGRWLLTVPAHHIIGMQVLLRSLSAGYTPHRLSHTSRFVPAELAPAIEGLLSADTSASGIRHYCSLVPSQWDTLLCQRDSGDPRERRAAQEALQALRQLDGILSGGAPLPQEHYQLLRSWDITVIRGYGCSEVGGGVLFDGRPGPATRCRVDENTGRISIAGGTLASGYVGDADWSTGKHSSTETATCDDDGTVWFHTADYGHWEDDQLIIDGRRDDAINSGGIILFPQALVEILRQHQLVNDAAVCGIPDPHFGEVVAAAVVPSSDCLRMGSAAAQKGRDADLEEEWSDRLRHHVQDSAGKHARPRRIVWVEEIPRTASGKIDRHALLQLVTRPEDHREEKPIV